MTHFRRARYGLASALGLAVLGVLASCVSGVDPSGGGIGQPDTGGQTGTAGTGNTIGQSGSTPVSTGGTSAGSAPMQQGGGGATAQGGSASTQGGANSQGGTGGQGRAGSASQGGTGGQAKGGSTGMAGTTGVAGTTGGPQPLPRITGSTGFATRYWDCCKPACSNNKVSCSSGTSTDGGGNQSACAGGNSFMCYNFEPFQDPDNKYISYAYAASHRACGSCWEIQFTGSAGCSEGASCPGNASGLLYNTVFVQVLNTGSIADDQFDLLIPGGGVGEFNACSNEWGRTDLGAQYGGFLTGCNGSVTCTQAKCNDVFAGKPDLLAGCNWFLGWYTAADNPQITFKQVSCPSQLTSKSGMSG